MPKAPRRGSRRPWAVVPMRASAWLSRLSSASRLAERGGGPSSPGGDEALRGDDATRRVSDDENGENAQRIAYADCARSRSQRAARQLARAINLDTKLIDVT